MVRGFQYFDVYWLEAFPSGVHFSDSSSEHVVRNLQDVVVRMMQNTPSIEAPWVHLTANHMMVVAVEVTQAALSSGAFREEVTHAALNAIVWLLRKKHHGRALLITRHLFEDASSTVRDQVPLCNCGYAVVIRI